MREFAEEPFGCGLARPLDILSRLRSASITSRKVCVVALGLSVWIAAAPAGAQSRSEPNEGPLRYTVHFGAMLGQLEPVAGTTVCDVAQDCIIQLSIWPKMDLVLRASSRDGRSGTAVMDCPTIACTFATGSKTIAYRSDLNEFDLYHRRDESSAILTLPVLRPQERIGQISFIVEKASRPSEPRLQRTRYEDRGT